MVLLKYPMHQLFSETIIHAHDPSTDDTANLLPHTGWRWPPNMKKTTNPSGFGYTFHLGWKSTGLGSNFAYSVVGHGGWFHFLPGWTLETACFAFCGVLWPTSCQAVQLSICVHAQIFQPVAMTWALSTQPTALPVLAISPRKYTKTSQRTYVVTKKRM
jgi:hypothetical protein